MRGPSDPAERKRVRKESALQRRLKHFHAAHKVAASKRGKLIADKQIARVELDIQRHEEKG